MLNGATEVIKMDKATIDEIVVAKHYSHRASIFWAGFGLLENNVLTGVVVYGQPSPPIQKHAFKDRDFRLYELARLVVWSETKNASSFLVGNSLRRLERPSAVVSYADMEHSHCGFVYQATNWIYTGAQTSHDHAYLVDGRRVHPITLRDRGISDPKRWARENGIQTVKPHPKHRYFFLNGSKTDRKRMRAALAYTEVKPYPKCDPARYDDGPAVDIEYFPAGYVEEVQHA